MFVEIFEEVKRLIGNCRNGIWMNRVCPLAEQREGTPEAEIILL